MVQEHNVMRVNARNKFRSTRVLLLSCILAAGRTAFAQDAHQMVKRPDISDVDKDCNQLRNTLRRTRAPGGQAGKLIGKALGYCDEYRKKRITQEQWSTHLMTLDEEATFIEVPPEFISIIPFKTPRIFSGYDTYTLFLFPSADWKKKKKEVKQLYEEFTAFADAIGDRRLAIWFANAHDDVDPLRSKLYCDRLGLRYNDGPFVVTLQKPPAAWQSGDQAIIISLAEISQARKLVVLNALENDLRTARSLSQRPLLFVEIRERLVSAAARHKSDLKDIVVKALGK